MTPFRRPHHTSRVLIALSHSTVPLSRRQLEDHVNLPSRDLERAIASLLRSSRIIVANPGEFPSRYALHPDEPIL